VTEKKKTTKKAATSKSSKKTAQTRAAPARERKASQKRSPTPKVESSSRRTSHSQPTSSKPKESQADQPAPLTTNDQWRLVQALEQMEDAQKLASARAQDILAIADNIGEAAVALTLERMLKGLVDLKVLRDIAALQAAFEELHEDELPEALRAFRHLPLALIQCFETAFGLTVDRQAGDEFEIPADQLSRLEVEGSWPDSMGEHVCVRVLASGWKRETSQLVAPRVRILEPAHESE
jgi:hypothetical protein